jgi:AhpD family alkylhydroperoxidase
MSESTYPPPTRSLTRRRAEAAPEIYEAFQEFSRRAFAEGALPEKTKQLIAVAVAHATQCPYCIRGHTRLAKRRGASNQEIMEAIWVASEMRAGAAYAHSLVALDELGGEDR